MPATVSPAVRPILPPAPRPPGWALVSSGTAPIALIGGWVVGGAVQPSGRYDLVRQTISVLAGHAATDRWIMTAGLYLLGVCHVVTAAGLRGAPRPSRVALAVAGVLVLGVATFAESRDGATTAHLWFATLGIGLTSVFGVLLGARGATRFPLRPRDAALAAVLSVLLIGWLLLAGEDTVGLAERALTAEQVAWPLLAVIALRVRSRDCRPETMNA